MKHASHWAMTLATLLFVTSGCGPGKYTGGGWTISPSNPQGKATFGGNFQAIDADGDGQVFDPFAGFDPNDEFKGQFQYNDHAAGVAFHGEVTEGYICTDPQGLGVSPLNRPSNWNIPGAGFIRGTYTPIPKSAGPGGTFEIMVRDLGTAGPNPGDQIWVALFGGVLNGYNSDSSPNFPPNDNVFGQVLQGGQLQYHPAK